VVAHLPASGGPVLWIQDRQSQRETGKPYLAGMAHPPEMLFLTVNRAVDVLWAMEQGLGSSGLSAVVGEVWGDPPALDFTASKRLALRSEAHGVPAWLIRRAATADLSAARERWRLASLPSLPNPADMRSPGAPQWRADLFRARWRTPGQWVVRYDAASHSLAFDHPVSSGTAAEYDLADRQQAAG
jgi:protein ImuA